MLYFQILEEQGKLESCLSVMSGPLGQLCKVDRDRQKLLIYYNSKLGKYDQVEKITKDLLQKK